MPALQNFNVGDTVFVAFAIVETHDVGGWQLQAHDGTIIVLPKATVLAAGVIANALNQVPAVALQATAAPGGKVVRIPTTPLLAAQIYDSVFVAFAVEDARDASQIQLRAHDGAIVVLPKTTILAAGFTPGGTATTPVVSVQTSVATKAPNAKVKIPT